jgi:hypothetical protein
MKELGTGILSYNDVVKEHDKLLNMVKNEHFLWKKASVFKDKELNKQKSVRNTDIVKIPYYINHVDEKTTKDKISNILTKSFNKPINQYFEKYLFSTNSHYEYSLLRYGVGQKFDDHIDHNTSIPRSISLVYYLNDDYAGGEINFSILGIKIKPVKNQLIIFPSNYIYRHSVQEVTEGTRYSVVTWLS